MRPEIARCSIGGAALSLVQRGVPASLSSAWRISPTPSPWGARWRPCGHGCWPTRTSRGCRPCSRKRKTALAFHAKDDLPEVRREVFSLLLRHQMHFFAVVRDKLKVVEYVRQRNEREPSYRYNPNELYDYLVRRLFRDRLHKDDEYEIFFAKRGKSDRTKALLEALQAARNRFSQRWGMVSEAPIHVFPATPSKCPGLQAADYFLWALQRLYERHEERFVALLWPLVSLVHDVDDTREARYGVYYTKKKPLTLAAIKDLPGI